MIDSDEELPPQESIPIINGIAKCPWCDTDVSVGAAGIANLYKKHLKKGRCNNQCQKEKEKRRPRQKGPLFAWMKPKPKANPSTVSAPLPIPSSSNPSNSSSPIPAITPPIATSSPEPPYLAVLKDYTARLSLDVPEATETDYLASFCNPEHLFGQRDVDVREMWEEGVNRKMHVFQGLTVGQMAALIRRGPMGVQAFYSFVKYFVEKGVDPVLFELRVECLIEAMRPRLVPEAPQSPHSHTPTSDTMIDLTTEVDEHTRHLCEGYTLTFAAGKSPYTHYPFAMHHHHTLPWRPFVNNNDQLTIRSRECTIYTPGDHSACTSCQRLEKNDILIRIMERAEEGVEESTMSSYYAHVHWVEKVDRKNRQINTLKLRGLNNSRLLDGRASALDRYKSFVRGLKDGRVEHVDRLIRVGLKRQLGIGGLIDLYERAAVGAYHPRSYAEKDYLKGLVNLRLGGVRMAHFAHRAEGLPSVSTLRAHSTTKPLVPSSSSVSQTEIQQNVEIVLNPRELDFVRSQTKEKIVHANLQIDELAVERRMRYSNQLNKFLGACREHGKLVSLDFNSMEELDELYRAIDGGEVHEAHEATVGAVGIFTSNKRLYNCRPVLISGTCKREDAPEHAKVIRTLLDAVRSKKSLIGLRIVSVASDGFPELQSLFDELDADVRNVDILKPLGELLVNRKLDEDDNEDGDMVPIQAEPTDADASPAVDVFGEDSGIRQFEDTAADEEENEDIPERRFSTKLDIGDGKMVNKSRLLSTYARVRRQDPTSTDRKRRVIQMSRFSTSIVTPHVPNIIDSSTGMEGPSLMVSEPIASILSCEDQFFLCIGEVIDIHTRNGPVDDIFVDDLLEEGVTVQYQLLHIKPATEENDPTRQNDWRSSPATHIHPVCFDIPGHLVQPLNPMLVTPDDPAQKSFYLFRSDVLRALAETLLNKLAELGEGRAHKIPKTPRSQFFPYWTTGGEAAFLCEHDGIGHGDIEGYFTCPSCTDPVVYLDSSKPQAILKHIGAHVLNAPSTLCSSEPCCFCLSSSPQCQIYLNKKGGISRKLTRCPVFESFKGFSYAAASKSTKSNPCTNVPVKCEACARINANSPAVCKYNLEEHYKKRHPNTDSSGIAIISRSERQAMEGRLQRSQEGHATRMTYRWHSTTDLQEGDDGNYENDGGDGEDEGDDLDDEELEDIPEEGEEGRKDTDFDSLEDDDIDRILLSDALLFQVPNPRSNSSPSSNPMPIQTVEEGPMTAEDASNLEGCSSVSRGSNELESSTTYQGDKRAISDAHIDGHSHRVEVRQYL
ncbi:hypothetical protein D9758_015582 [Tetrapyrgos nigripes]|uniref:Uncharacterized protein n=1 Tax=Tetrapyrgos nigripes TaxID=182062 RepID=A0A8H5FKF7_9AGAR|nr:hypothetical protein D9758_015582 [Tetrapyrgos nigripes]